VAAVARFVGTVGLFKQRVFFTVARSNKGWYWLLIAFVSRARGVFFIFKNKIALKFLL
jgi:hypothetical protein